MYVNMKWLLTNEFCFFSLFNTGVESVLLVSQLSAGIVTLPYKI